MDDNKFLEIISQQFLMGMIEGRYSSYILGKHYDDEEIKETLYYFKVFINGQLNIESWVLILSQARMEQ